MKLMISKSRDGNGYYTKVQNDYNGKHTEKYLSVQLPKDTNVEYGLYDVDGFLSTFEKKNGEVEFKLVVTDITKIEREEKSTNKNKPFEDFGEHVKTDFDLGEQLQIKDEDLPF